MALMVYDPYDGRGGLATLLLASAWVVLWGVSVAGNEQPQRPNILICMADDASYPYMGAYGCRWVKTPAFDRVARDGLLFTRCYTPNPKCAPSRASFLTGRYPWQLGAACNHWCFFPSEYRTFMEVLAECGYYTGMTGKGWGPGIARDADGKPRQMTGKPFNRRQTEPPASGISRNDYAANFEDFLQSVPPGKPWCFWYGSLEPHRSYEEGSGEKIGGKEGWEIERIPGYWPDTEAVRRDLLDYAVEVEYFDRHLGRMLQVLEQRGLLANTLVVVTSDNGMPFPRAKGQLYEISAHMPLAVMWPDGIRRPGRVVDDYVSFVDLAPTILEAAGVDGVQQGMAPMAGRSLLDIFRSEKEGQVEPTRDHVLLGKERHDVGRPDDQGYPIRGILADGLLYLHNFHPERWPAGNPETGYLNCDGSPTKTWILQQRDSPGGRRFWELSFGRRPAEELYDLRGDPDCLNNLAGLPQWQRRKEALKNRLFQYLARQGDPRMTGQGDVFEQYPYADPRTRDFYNRYMRGEKLRAGWVNPSDFQSLEPGKREKQER